MGQVNIILAADELTLAECVSLAEKIGNRVYAFKIHNLLDEYGPRIIKQLLDAGARHVWADVKLHDIPNTVRKRAAAIAKAGASILTVHASGEIDMMKAAVEAGPAEIYAVTALTSLTEEEVQLTYGQSPKAVVLRLARLAKLAGVHGIVCSPQEVGMLAERAELQGIRLITPGIRSAGQSADDQKRIDTPAGTVRSGATDLVIGRGITQAADPVEALNKIMQEIISVTA